jgi:hypothetical protein
MQLSLLCICLAEEWCDDALFISAYSKFSEICSSSEVSNPLPTVDIFLVVYEDTI